MITRILLLFLAFLPFNFSLQAGLWSSITEVFGGYEKPMPSTIRVLVAHDLEGVNLEVKGKYSLYDPYTNSYISTRFIGKNRYLQALSDGLKWGEAFPGLYQLKIKPEEESARIIVDNKEYQGSLYIYDIGGTISAINEILIEDYVSSILATYNTLSWSPEVLAAIAIVTRTNAYYQAFHPKNTYWAVDASKVGYQGNIPLVDPEVKQAIEATRHMVMSRTGVYERVATPFAAQFGPVTVVNKDFESSKISLEQAEEMARQGNHAALILAKAFPGTTIMLMQPSSAH